MPVYFIKGNTCTLILLIPPHEKEKLLLIVVHLTIEGILQSKKNGRSGGVKEKVQKKQPWRTN